MYYVLNSSSVQCIGARSQDAVVVTAILYLLANAAASSCAFSSRFAHALSSVLTDLMRCSNVYIIIMISTHDTEELRKSWRVSSIKRQALGAACMHAHF
jgi:hypothetical protein